MDAKRTDGDAPVGGGSAETNTGRWTKAEHELFLRGLNDYGKDWKQIGSLIKTRTVVQIRTHAQKYFLAHKKHDSENNSAGEVTPGSASPTSTLPDNSTKSSSKKRTLPIPNKSNKTKKKKDVEDGLDSLGQIFDLVDAWSSGSDEGTPTALDELDFLKAPVLSPFPHDSSVDDTQQQEHLSTSLSMVDVTTMQPASTSDESMTHSMIESHSVIESQAQLHLVQRPIHQSLHLQQPQANHSVQQFAMHPHPQQDSAFVDMAGSDFDPLPPSLEYVHFGRWMDTMTE